MDSTVNPPHPAVPPGSHSIPASETTAAPATAVSNSSFPYRQTGVMMSSTASLVGMLKATALNNFQSLSAATQDDASPESSDQDDASPESSDSESTEGQPYNEAPLPILRTDSTENFQQLRARRIVINRFASTLLYQHTAVQQALVDSPHRFNSSSASPQSPSKWSSTSSIYGTSPTHFSSLQSQPPLLERDEDSSDEPNVITEEDHLKFVIDQFGPWSGTNSNGQPELETWIRKVPGVLTRNVLVEGTMLLTSRRLCYIAYLPVVDMGQIIRSGPVTLPSNGIRHKRTRSWIELRTDSLTQYKSSTKLFRPIFSLHLSQVKHVLPIPSASPKILRLRLYNGKIFFAEFDTAEATAAWHADFVNVLFNFKTHHSNKIKIMIPLCRIRKLHRDTFENLAKVMSLDIDFAPSLNDLVNNDIIEEKFTQQKFDRTRVQLSYLLTYGNFDDLILDAIVRAKLATIKDGSIGKQRAPHPLLKITTVSIDEKTGDRNKTLLEHEQAETSKDIHMLTSKFITAFGLEANSNLPIYPCSLLRTLPSWGHVAISKDYFCFWHRGIPVISPDYKLRIPLHRIRDSKPTSGFGFHRYGLEVEVLSSPDIRLDFTSKSTRDSMIEELKTAVGDATHNSKGLGVQPASRPLPGQTVNLPGPRRRRSQGIGCGAFIDPVRPLRIVCLTIGSRGDVQPYIALAKRLMQDGHTVTIASHPEYRSWVESFGILYKDVGGDPGALMNFSVEHSFFSAGFFKEGLSYFAKWLEELFQEAWIAVKDSEAEVLIESPSTFSGIHIAEALCIPYFRAFTMTWTSTTMYPQAFASSIDLGPSYNLLSYSLFDMLIWRAMARQVNRWRKKTLHIPPTSLEKMQAYKVPFMYNFSSAVVPKPIDWRDHIDVTGYWFLDQSQHNFVPPEELVKFIASAKDEKIPLVYIGFGSVTVPDSTAVTKSIYSAVVQAGVRAIVAKGWSDRVEEKSKKEEPVPPPEVYVLQAIPHDWLFPQMDAVCHHGGAGTTGISLRFGLPTIIHPFFGDQTFWADRVSRLGAGVKIDSLSANALCEAFKKATSDRIIKEKAAQVKERIQAEDGPTRAVQFMYQYLDFALERTEHRIERTRPKNSKFLKPLENESLNSPPDQRFSRRSRNSILHFRSIKRGRLSDGPEVKEPRTTSCPEDDRGASAPRILQSPSSRNTSPHTSAPLTSEPDSFLRPDALQLPSNQDTTGSTIPTPTSEINKFISLKDVGRTTNELSRMKSTLDAAASTERKQGPYSRSLKRLTS